MVATLFPHARALAVLMAISATCGRGAATPSGQNRVSTGQWGGQHVGMVVTEAGAELEFDCAHGRIEEPIALERSGRFDARGTYTPERPGPRREDETGRAVRYVGRVDGKTMTLTIDASGGSTDSASYTLEHGREPVIRKCL